MIDGVRATVVVYRTQPSTIVLLAAGV